MEQETFRDRLDVNGWMRPFSGRPVPEAYAEFALRADVDERRKD